MATIREIIEYQRQNLAAIDAMLEQGDIEDLQHWEQERALTRDTIAYLETLEKYRV